MGISDFPHARSVAAVEAALGVVRRDADLSVVHFDDGVPWDEAASGAAYPPGYQSSLDFKARSQPPGHLRYLAVTPLRFLRDGLAERRGNDGTEPLRPPWDRRRLDDPETIAAYLAHCERMIETFRPDFFTYGVEVNILAQSRPDLWPGLVNLLETTYARLKARYPALSVLLTFQVDFLRASPGPQAAAIREVVPFTDLVGASTYAYTQQSDPRALPADFFDGLVALGAGKPFAVAETGWPGEPVTSPYPAFIPASEDAQRAYVEWLLGQGDRHRALFVVYLIGRDYDELWEAELRSLESASLLRLWKDVDLSAARARRAPSATLGRRLARPRR